MTSLAKLLARKQRLLERLQEGPGPHERDEIERLLAEIDEALALLDESGPGIAEIATNEPLILSLSAGVARNSCSLSAIAEIGRWLRDTLPRNEKSRAQT